jgi:hypothetical protein
VIENHVVDRKNADERSSSKKLKSPGVG